MLVMNIILNVDAYGSYRETVTHCGLLSGHVNTILEVIFLYRCASIHLLRSVVTHAV